MIIKTAFKNECINLKNYVKVYFHVVVYDTERGCVNPLKPTCYLMQRFHLESSIKTLINAWNGSIINKRKGQKYNYSFIKSEELTDQDLDNMYFYQRSWCKDIDYISFHEIKKGLNV